MEDDPAAPSAVGFSPGDPVGTIVGDRYRIVELVATGGMARVYQATDGVLGRQVALKILHEHLVSDDAFVERFRHEAIAAAKLSHPFIVSIFDTVSETTPEGFRVEAIVMELVHGTTLRRRLDVVDTLDVDEAVAVGTQVADALHTAHRARVVHRDIKPANILLSTDGRVLVADFGIAKAAEGHDLTAEGSMLGTAKYLAPEQVEGAAVDGRADVYALGVVLYEALCGRVPFLADTDTGTALARLHQAPLRPRQVRADIPRPIEEVILRAMARHPEDRYSDAAQFRAALLGCMDGPTSIEITVDQTNVIDRETVAVGAIRDRTPVPMNPGHPAAPPSQDPPAAPDRSSRRGFGRSERAWLVPTLLIVLVMVALGVVGVLFGQSKDGNRALGSPPEGSSIVSDPPPRITAAHVFDPPPGDGVENDALLGNLTDGSSTTSWRTSTYDAAPELGVKDGVGLRLVLDEVTGLDSLVVDSPTAGWDASVYVTSGSPDDTLASWGPEVTAQRDLAAGTTTFDLHGKQGDQVLLWITLVGDSGRVEITGIQVR